MTLFKTEVSMRNTEPQSFSTRTQTVEFDAGLRSYMLRIYNYMASAVLLTGLVAWFASQSEAVQGLLWKINAAGQVGPSGLGYVAMFAPLAIVFYLSARMHKMTQATAQAWFWGFAVAMGLSLHSIFLAYTGVSIARVFFITSASFGALSLYGYTTKKDLGPWGAFLFMSVVGLIIASIVNMFVQSNGLHFAISAIGVVTFAGLTAYDTQKLKNMYYQIAGDAAMMNRMVIMGALNLYLDFINLFIMLLHLFGDRR